MYKPRTIILVLGLTAFAPVLRVGFLWDDHVMIENNPQIQTWSIDALRQDFSSDMFRGRGDLYFRPLQVLSNRIDYTVWGLRPIGHHLTQIAIHLGNALLFYELLIALGAPMFLGLVAGSLFVVHPIIVEEIMIIAGRGEILSLLFMLGSLLCLLKKKPWEIAAGYTLFACALLTKESAIVLPALLALLYYQQSRPRRDYLHAGGLLLLTLPYFVLRHHAVGSLAFPHSPALFANFFFFAFPNILIKYLVLLLLPWNLHSHRLMPHLSHAWPLYLAFLVGGMAWLVHKQHRIAWVGIAWFILCLLPKTPVMMLGNFMLDHWVYPSSLAFFVLVAWGITEGWQSRTAWVKNGAGAAYGMGLILLALLVHLNVALRGTDEKMYRWALYFTTSNPIKYNLGILLLQTGRAGEAVPYLEDVHKAYPEDLSNINALALSYYYAGHPKIALILLERAHQQYPNDPLTQKNLNQLHVLLHLH